MNLILCGHSSDSVSAGLWHTWSRAGAAVHFLDLDQIDRVGRLTFQRSDGQESGLIETPGWRLTFADLSVIFLRFLGVQQAVRRGARRPEDGARLQTAYARWMEVLEGIDRPIVNRLSASCSNHSKPYQLQQMRAQGLLVPPTLVTNDVNLARDFWREHRRVVFKSISGFRARTQLLDAQNQKRLEWLPWCPTLFQLFIPGVDVRVHVVGDNCFAVQVEGAEIDYRFSDRTKVSIRVCNVPPTIAEQCRRITHFFGLHLSGIDFRVTQAGDWYALEVNPTPAFTDYETWSGQPLAASVLTLLQTLSLRCPGFRG